MHIQLTFFEKMHRLRRYRGRLGKSLWKKKTASYKGRCYALY